jgi:hypothetical protein
MSNEEKRLLLIDLCARLPYDVKMEYCGKAYSIFSRPFKSVIYLTNGADQVSTSLSKCKPYLRPLSSMTQEEIDEYDAELDKDMDIVMDGSLDKDRHTTSDGKHTFSKNFVAHFGNDWLNKKGFDYRGLIPMGLALEAPQDMYKTG